MRIFVAGGTGYLGSALVSAARAAGHRVTVLARSEAAANRARALGALVFPGDMAQPGSVARAGLEHDVLVHVASLVGADRVFEDRRPVEEWEIDDAAARVGPIAEASTRDQRVIATRSAAVLDWRPMRPRLIDAVPELYRERMD